jgi:hypothetical protein
VAEVALVQVDHVRLEAVQAGVAAQLYVTHVVE